MGLGRLSLLRSEEIEEEQEEEDQEEEEEEQDQSGRECDYCGEKLKYTEEVFVLEVVEAAKENDTIFHDILRGDDGDYLHRPYMMHVSCWEDLLETIDEAIADRPPMEAENAILECSRCESTIGNFEPFVAATFGEIRKSPRQPSGEPSAFFEPLGHITPVCLLCIVHVVEDYLDDWEDLIDSLPNREILDGEQEDE